MSIKSLSSELTAAGLSEKAALVYAAVIELGSSTPSRISEHTRLNRSTVYKILAELCIKGLVTEIDKAKKLHYHAERPDRLARYAKSQADKAADAYENVKKMVPFLEDIYSLAPNKPKIRFFEDVEGIKSIVDDYLDTDEPYELCGMANTNALESFVSEKFFKDFIRSKERLGITTRGIIPESERARSFPKRIFGHVKKPFWPKFRYIPEKMFPFQGEIILYRGNRVSIANCNKDNLTGIIIEDKHIHDALKAMFELAWVGAKEFETKKTK